MATIQFRESQRQVIEGYTGGMMGISAVPGSGKTFTLSHLAARLVTELSRHNTEQDVLIVTFSNSAVNSFKSKIANILQHDKKLLPFVGYQVRTLHGLAHDIVRERPALLGLSEDFQIIDERVSSAILLDTIRSKAVEQQNLLNEYLSEDVSEQYARRIQHQQFPDLLFRLVQRYIQHAKNHNVDPSTVNQWLSRSSKSYKLLSFANEIYDNYQRVLRYRGAVDFDDLVMLALRSLENDQEYLKRLQERYPYILEDEAQDSSLLQERMLGLLTGNKNWVRVGDPNQAINTTFTSADSQYLVNFLDNNNVQKHTLPTSGRCGQPIIDIANRLVQWAIDEHPAPELRNAFYKQFIEPTAPDDPQQNPPADQCLTYIHYQDGETVAPEQEINFVTRSIKKFITENPDKTIAALVPENKRGYKLAEALKKANIPYNELLRSTTTVRETATILVHILTYLSKPHDAKLLANLYTYVWLFINNIEPSQSTNSIAKYLRSQRNVELILSMSDDRSLQMVTEVDDTYIANLEAFYDFTNQILALLELPIDQIILSLSQKLFSDPVDIALCYKISALLRHIDNENIDYQMKDYLNELKLIAQNQRRFIGFEDHENGYNPIPGQVTISTMHASKGLEWDRVYLMAVSNYGFPSLSPTDTYISEKKFLRSNLNLESECLSQLESFLWGRDYSEGNATLDSRAEYSAERLRLLYVAITRAKYDMCITWNNGSYESVKNHLSFNVYSFL